jgi:hypothetical protein
MVKEGLLHHQHCPLVWLCHYILPEFIFGVQSTKLPFHIFLDETVTTY